MLTVHVKKPVPSVLTSDPSFIKFRTKTTTVPRRPSYRTTRWVCGGLCPVSELCASTCNAYWLEGGTIEIGKLQEFACKVFREMKVKQIRDPNLKPLDPRVAKTKIALIGAGSASLSCASFLGRLGYENVDIFEKNNYSGGLVTNEIPPNRSNWEDVAWEINMVE